MGLFDETLRADESLFLDAMPLDIDFMPPIVPYREQEQQHIATCIKPLFQKRNGMNLVMTGTPGIGKTVAVKHVLNELKKETEGIHTIYINCWKKDTAYKIALDVCNQIGFKFTLNRKTDELLQEISRIVNKKSCVLVLDEIDKMQDVSVLYNLLEDLHRKTIILITNEKEWLADLDQRIKSRLTPDMLEFKPYNFDELKGILQERVRYAFVPNVLEQDAFDLIVQKTFEAKDVRVGLHLLKESGDAAESRSSRRIRIADAEQAVKKLKEFTVKSKTTLDLEENKILDLLKMKSGMTTKELHKLYLEKDGSLAYSSFSRKIKNLERGKFITLTERNTGHSGRSTVVDLGDKKLQEF